MKVQAIELERPRHARKNTSKWCKGKVGRLHDMERMLWVDLPNAYARTNPHRYDGYLGRCQVDRCRNCGKQKFLGYPE